MPTWRRIPYSRFPAIIKGQTTGNFNSAATGTNILISKGNIRRESTRTNCRISSGERVGCRRFAREDKLESGENYHKIKRRPSVEDKHGGDSLVNSSGTYENDAPVIQNGLVSESKHPETATDAEPNHQEDAAPSGIQESSKIPSHMDKILKYYENVTIDENLNKGMEQSYMKRDFLSGKGRISEFSIVSGKIPPRSMFENADPNILMLALTNFVKLRDSPKLTGAEVLNDLMLCLGAMTVSDEFTENVSMNLGEYGIAEIIGKIWRQNFTGSPMMLTDSEEDKISFQLLNCASEVVALVSACESSALWEKLLEAKMPLLLLYLLSEDQRLQGSNISIYNNVVLGPLLSMLAQFSQTEAGAECLVACGARNALRQYCSRKVQLQVLSNEGDGLPPATVAWSFVCIAEILTVICLVNITDEVERATMDVTENLGLMLGMLFIADRRVPLLVGSPGVGRYRGILNPLLMVQALSRLAANDENSTKMIEHGVLQFLEDLLQPAASTELKTLAAQTVRNLALKNRDAILAQPGCMKGEQNFKTCRFFFFLS